MAFAGYYQSMLLFKKWRIKLENCWILEKIFALVLDKKPCHEVGPGSLDQLYFC
jgi:hypothetical protein